jgi:hypothetical protein
MNHIVAGLDIGKKDFWRDPTLLMGAMARLRFAPAEEFGVAIEVEIERLRD